VVTDQRASNTFNLCYDPAVKANICVMILNCMRLEALALTGGLDH